MMKSLPNLTGPMPMWPRCVSLKISRIPIASAAQNRTIPNNRFLKSIFLIFFPFLWRAEAKSPLMQSSESSKSKSPQSGRFINRTAAFLRNRHQRRTKRRAASVKIPGEMIEHNGFTVSQINLPFSKFDRPSWLRHTWRFRLRQSRSQQRAVRKWFRHNQSMQP